MKKILTISLIIAVLGVLIAGIVPVAAADEEPPAEIKVSSTAPLLINGVLTTTFPVTVAAGTTVAIVDNIYYTSAGERWSFQGWSNGIGTSSITVINPGTYIANWSREILIQISSVVTSLNNSMWLPYNQVTNITVPNVVAVNSTARYRFTGWSGGETPYQTNNSFAPFQPMTLKAEYTLEYYLTITAPDGISIIGTGWYTNGASLVVQAPPDVYDDTMTSRMHFNSWESIGYPVMVVPTPTSNVATFKIDGPYIIRANYDKQYLVEANSPFGKLKHEWISENSDVKLEAPAVLDIIPEQERYVFLRWTGMEGLTSPTVSGVVTQAVVLTAVYEHQYYLTVSSPANTSDTGPAISSSGSGWYKAGSATTVTVPMTNQTSLFLRSRFNGFTGYSGTDNTQQVLVNSPVTVTANYVNGLDLRVMGIIIAVALVIIFLFIWGFGRFRRRG